MTVHIVSLLAQTATATSSDVATGLIVIGFIAMLAYFLPTFIAAMRNHTSTLAIFVVNLVFGWSLIGWFVALIWALADNGRNRGSVVYQINQGAPPIPYYPSPPPPPAQPYFSTPPLPPQSQQPYSTTSIVGGNKGACPYCASVVSAQAVYCPHCGKTLAPGSVRVCNP